MWKSGYGDYKEDPGGCTNRGITIHTWRRFGYDKNGDGVITCEDVRQITREDARKIYKKWFWEANGGDLIVNQKLAEIIVDWAVNSGAGIAIVRVQRILNSMGNNLSTDGIVGAKTINAINTANQKTCIAVSGKKERFFIELLQLATQPFVSSCKVG